MNGRDCLNRRYQARRKQIVMKFFSKIKNFITKSSQNRKRKEMLKFLGSCLAAISLLTLAMTGRCMKRQIEAN